MNNWGDFEKDETIETDAEILARVRTFLKMLGETGCKRVLVVNPGDSFDCPDTDVNVLFVPISAPWLKIVEPMDFVNRVKPPIVIPVHDALLSDLGKSISGNWMKKACNEVGTEYRYLSFGENVVC